MSRLKRLSNAARPAAAVALLLLAAACATAPRERAPAERFPLDPREGLPGPFPDSVTNGWTALLRGDARAALREFDGARSEKSGLAAEIGWIEAAVLLGRFEESSSACRDALGAGEPTVPLLVACGEANGRGGKPVEGFRLYRRALSRPEGAHAALKERSEQLRLAGRDAMAAEARLASEEKRWAESRERIAVAIDLAPEFPALRTLAAELEEAAGEPEKAFRRYREALEMDPHNSGVAERAGELAGQLGDHAYEVSIFDELARTDAKYKARAEEARLSFRVANWPAPEREAAGAARLTRASAADLVWWMFPEVREARVSNPVIASDAVSRRDTRAFARAVSLGLLEVDRETHRGSPDATLTRGAGARLLVRLVGIVHPGGASCLGKLAGHSPRSTAEATRAADACGLWKEGEAGPPSGPEFTRALDRVRSLAESEPTPEASDE